MIRVPRSFIIPSELRHNVCDWYGRFDNKSVQLKQWTTQQMQNYLFFESRLCGSHILDDDADGLGRRAIATTVVLQLIVNSNFDLKS